MPILHTIEDSVLEPVPVGQQPGGTVLSDEDWIHLRRSRPNAYDTTDKGIWTPVDEESAGWPRLKDLASSLLSRKSKDLRVAVWLTEANIVLHGFAGLRDGLRLIRELLMRFWDAGLRPEIQSGDLELRSGPLEWMDEKMADLIAQIPVTRRNDGPNYSYNYYLESLRPAGGKITSEEFQAAVKATPVAAYRELHREMLESRAELQELERVAEEKFGPEALSFAHPREVLEDCRKLLESILRKLPAGEAAGNPDLDRPRDAGAPAAQTVPVYGTMLESGVNGDSWQNAERLARAGQTDQALAEMTRLAAVEPNGRARFQRKLLLAEICLQTGRHRLARAVLEELAEQIEVHQLATWETSELIGAVWSRLYRCYRNEQAGTADADLAAKYFAQLCRLDPWQALACNEAQEGR
jgi:type VI secretion system protein ImpA